jgi:hypothetical protein
MVKTILGGGVVAFLTVLGMGSAVGAATVPIPGFGSVGVDTAGAITCANVTSPDIPQESVNTCVDTTSNQLGQPDLTVTVQNGPGVVDATLNPLFVGECGPMGCIGLNSGGVVGPGL